MKKLIFILAFVFTLGAYNSANASGDLKKILKKVGDELGKELVSTRSESTGSSSSSSYKSPTKRRDDGRLKTESDLECYKLKVKSCTVDDNDVATIEFSIENLTDKDISGYIGSYDSKVYDDEGTCYDDNYLSLAKANGDFDRNVSFTLPSELSMKFRMRIKNIDPSASVLKRVMINTWNYSKNQNGYMTIYNLPITREGDE